jgi:hypothetical protein
VPHCVGIGMAVWEDYLPQEFQLGAHAVRRYVMKPMKVESAPPPVPRWTALRRLSRAGTWRT